MTENDITIILIVSTSSGFWVVTNYHMVTFLKQTIRFRMMSFLPIKHKIYDGRLNSSSHPNWYEKDMKATQTTIQQKFRNGICWDIFMVLRKNFITVFSQTLWFRICIDDAMKVEYLTYRQNIFQHTWTSLHTVLNMQLISIHSSNWPSFKWATLYCLIFRFPLITIIFNF